MECKWFNIDITQTDTFVGCIKLLPDMGRGCVNSHNHSWSWSKIGHCCGHGLGQSIKKGHMLIKDIIKSAIKPDTQEARHQKGA